ncbi:adenylosuccinate lyase [Neisseriaceae bacterium PsAf]|nr:adenylosuccinate lyase [Neisseriaceae bacterium PsAf]
MSVDLLSALSPLDGRYHSKTEVLSPYFSEYGLIRYRVMVEILWLQHLSEIEKIEEIPTFSQKTQTTFKEVINNFSLDDARKIKEIEKTTNHDVKAVEYWLKETFKDNIEVNEIKEFFHFACTSEDINNVSYALMLRDANREVVIPQLEEVVDSLRNVAHTYASISMMSRTHGQPASPTTVGKEFANVVYRLERQLNKLRQFSFRAKINGAVGNYNAHVVAYPEINWPSGNQEFIESLGLEFNPYTIQIEPHDYIAEYFQILILINTILIDLSRDVWGYISLNYFKQKLKEGEVGSSTMPHKVNPIDFENAEGNLGLSNALLSHMSQKLLISRWQRDLTDSTVLRNIGVGLGYAVLANKSLLRGLSKLEVNQLVIERDLNRHWELLAEPIQTVMRRYGIDSPYEKLKALTRGKEKIDQKTIQDFINTLELPDKVKNELLSLTPVNYIGKAESLAESV